ncbi:MAG: dihydropteroate synthase [Oscillospiraceae bacterium]|nr:dihydropteroate synthase [Oscillospiraceae bacterium]
MYFEAGKYKLDLSKKTYIMGILNVTPDSFSDGGKYFDAKLAINRAFEIEKLGADILDIGAQSSRPGFTRISPEQELKRITPVLKRLKNKINIPISVDTFYPKVACAALEYDIDIINDVNGFKDLEMFKIASKSNCGIIIMHNLIDLTKENNINLVNNIDILNFFKNLIKKAEEYKIRKNRICLDPGIGFGKDLANNLRILANIPEFKIKDYAFLIGASRKRVIGELTGDKRKYGTIAAHSIANFLGANIIRTHDIEESIQALAVIDGIRKYARN